MIFNIMADIWNDIADVLPVTSLLWNYVLKFFEEIRLFFLELVCLNPSATNIFEDCKFLIVLIETTKNFLKMAWEFIDTLITFFVNIVLEIFKLIICYSDVWSKYCSYENGGIQLTVINVIKWVVVEIFEFIGGIFLYVIGFLYSVLLCGVNNCKSFNLYIANIFTLTNKFYIKIAINVFTHPIYVVNGVILNMQRYVICLFDMIICTTLSFSNGQPLCILKGVCEAVFSATNYWIIAWARAWLCGVYPPCPCYKVSYMDDIFIQVPCIYDYERIKEDSTCDLRYGGITSLLRINNGTHWLPMQ